jgi:hypothetical protein
MLTLCKNLYEILAFYCVICFYWRVKIMCKWEIVKEWKKRSWSYEGTILANGNLQARDQSNLEQNVRYEQQLLCKYFVQRSTNAQLIDKLSHSSFVFWHYWVIVRKLAVSILLRYANMSNAFLVIQFKIKIFHVGFNASSHYSCWKFNV